MAESLIPRHKEFPKRRLCMLMVTHSCNLNCTYCYEAYKDEQYMEHTLAKNILLKELAFVRHSEKFEELEINFMGGEPFLNLELIKEIVEWLCQLKQDIPFVTSCSTNGTLIDDTNKEWLYTHRNVFIPVLSYDGDWKMQQQNRHTAKTPIDMQFFMDTWPEESVHMTISKETLPYLAHGVLSLQRAGGKLDAALAQGIDWTVEDAVIFREQLCILKESYLEDITLKPINLLGRPLFGIGEGEAFQAKFCGTGTSMITYDINGKTYPCHIFSPIVVGFERALELEKSGIANNCHLTDPFCRYCNLKNWCPTCYGFNYRFRGDLSIRDHSWCKMIHTQAVTSCEFQIAYYHKHIEELSSIDMAQLKGALNAYRHLMDDSNIK
ncbi:MAG: 4Fe-4S cluster-binding domain-containing protein [Candidatus Omnitrophica bacterium]|nr:4Fe-4S cluster-binding domain-containing protein [Candidatus Omnitrophota bacterium]